MADRTLSLHISFLPLSLRTKKDWTCLEIATVRSLQARLLHYSDCTSKKCCDDLGTAVATEDEEDENDNLDARRRLWCAGAVRVFQ